MVSSLGEAGLGENGPITVVSANVIVTDLAQARGVKIRFREFANVPIVTLLLTTALANLIPLTTFSA